tara:strand:- start:772 stop:966 length:195 start_codon:yes stop_codon:yes gene_type:complete
METKPARVLTTDDIDMIAERAARKALDLVMIEVGRSVTKKVFLLAGLVALAAVTWAAKSGLLGD